MKELVLLRVVLPVRMQKMVPAAGVCCRSWVVSPEDTLNSGRAAARLYPAREKTRR